MTKPAHAMRGTLAKTPEAWIALWCGWTQACAEQLRDALLAGAPFELAVKWGNLLFSSHGASAVIHVDEAGARCWRSFAVSGCWKSTQL